MKWDIPPRIKVYEALGCLADKRIIIEGNSAEVVSSSGGKKYSVLYDSEKNAITSNDNGSYWKGYLGYPAIAFLLAKNIISYDHKLADVLKGISWKDINTKFKNDFDKTEKFILDEIAKNKTVGSSLNKEVNRILKSIKELSLNKLGETQKPPEGY